MKGAYHGGVVSGSRGEGPEKNPWWNATDYTQRQYQGAWEQGRRQGRRVAGQERLDL